VINTNLLPLDIIPLHAMNQLHLLGAVTLKPQQLKKQGYCQPIIKAFLSTDGIKCDSNV
jgi:hypothetical protein